MKPSASHVTARTHRVDVIEFDAHAGVLEIWLSPIVDRAYKRELNTPSSQDGVTTRKKRLDEPTCFCHHRMEDHAKCTAIKEAYGIYDHNTICLVPGCNCKCAQLKVTYAPSKKSTCDYCEGFGFEGGCMECGLTTQ